MPRPDRRLRRIPTQSVNLVSLPPDILGGEFGILGGQGVEDGKREHGGAARIGMEEIRLQEGSGFAFGHGLAVEGDRLVSHGVAHEIGERDDDDIAAGFGPFAEAFVGGEAGGFAGDLGIADDAGGGGGGSIGDIADDERAGYFIQELQAGFKMAGAIGIRGAVAVAKPEHKIDGDNQGRMRISDDAHLHRREGVGIQKEQGGRKIFDGWMRRGNGGIQIIAEFTFGGVGAAERFGKDKTGGSTGANHNDPLPRGIGGAEGDWEKKCEEEERAGEFHAVKLPFCRWQRLN